VLIIGAGKMSRLLVKHMHSKGCTRMTVLNRSMPRAEALAEEFPEVQFKIHLMGDLMKVRRVALLPRSAAPARGPWLSVLSTTGATLESAPACAPALHAAPVPLPLPPLPHLRVHCSSRVSPNRPPFHARSAWRSTT
jgi:hypothetical protein